MQITEAQR